MHANIRYTDIISSRSSHSNKKKKKHKKSQERQEIKIEIEAVDRAQQPWTRLERGEWGRRVQGKVKACGAHIRAVSRPTGIFPQSRRFVAASFSSLPSLGSGRQREKESSRRAKNRSPPPPPAESCRLLLSRVELLLVTSWNAKCNYRSLAPEGSIPNWTPIHKPDGRPAF